MALSSLALVGSSSRFAVVAFILNFGREKGKSTPVLGEPVCVQHSSLPMKQTGSVALS